MSLSLSLILAVALVHAQAPSAPAISGTVRDTTGQVVAGATVVARTPAGAEQRAITGVDGRFSISRSSPSPITLVVRAPGFGETRQDINVGAATTNLELVLHPATVSETVSVTAYGVPQR